VQASTWPKKKEKWMLLCEDKKTVPPCFAIAQEPNLIFTGIKFRDWLKIYEYRESLVVQN
jgi:hypothetical protein